MLSPVIPVLYESVDIFLVVITVTYSGYTDSLSVLPAPSAKFNPGSPCLRWFKGGQSIEEKGDVAWAVRVAH